MDVLIMEEFREVIHSFGLKPPIQIQPGKFYRFPGLNKNSSNNAGWCKVFLDGLGGCFGDFSSGISESWQSQNKERTREEYKSFLVETNKVRILAEKKFEAAQHIAQQEAERIWAECLDAFDDHPYLLKKHVPSYGLRVYKGEKVIAGMSCDGALVIPIRDRLKIQSLQFISLSGEKRFLPMGKKSGGYFNIGELSDNPVLCIAEGYVTAASIFLATGYPVAVSFDVGNIELVAKFLCQQFPNSQLIVCADDDYRKNNNPGLTKAINVAKIFNAPLAIPNFGVHREEQDTDFNDLHQRQGLDSVALCIRGAKKDHLDLYKNNDISTNIQPPILGIEPDIETQSFEYVGGHFNVTSAGVFFIGRDKEGNELAPRWICSKLIVLAKTRDAKSGEWGRLLEWFDDDKIKHQWAMPLELLQSDGSDVRRELARLGLSIAPGRASRELLASFLQMCPVNLRARCVDRLGWYGGAYVMPSETIGKKDEIVVFQNAHAIEPAFATSGTIEEWRNTIGKFAEGNSLLVFALSVAFASPLSEIIGEDSGGFHFRGTSSSGKTTALKLAASVWGHPDSYIRLWRTTANGLEGLAALHNDGLLILDELSQIDPKESGEAAYLLANGQGKTRASRNGAARKVAQWRLLFLSAGEESLAALMLRSGRKVNAGQEIRLADIDADAGSGMGVFEFLHNFLNPAALATNLKDSANSYHGTVGMAWLRIIVANKPSLPNLILEGVKAFLDKVLPAGATGQVIRVARRFALVAIAGELASKHGLTGWKTGESTKAAQKCFTLWIEAFGCSGNREERAIFAHVSAFFETHGASRFEDALEPNTQRVSNRAGFYRKSLDGEREFLVLPETFNREICQGFDPKMVVRVLVNAGWIKPGNDGKNSQKPRISGLGTIRCYVFSAKIWMVDED